MNREQAEKLVWFAISIEKLEKRGWPSKIWAITSGARDSELKEIAFHDDMLKQNSCAGDWLPFAFLDHFKWIVGLSDDGRINVSFAFEENAWGELFGIDEESFFYLFPQLRDEGHPKYLQSLNPYLAEIILKESPSEFKERVMSFIKNEHNQGPPLSR